MKRFSLATLLALYAVWATAANIPLHDFGDPNAAALWNQFHNLESGTARDPLRVVQLGDSHTAGDYFTGQLRSRMQEKFGNAGMGWLTPGYVVNQRSDQVWLRGTGTWQMSNSRVSNNSGIFPLGGLFNQSIAGAMLEIAAKQVPAEGLWRVSFWLQTARAAWQLVLPSGEKQALSPTESGIGSWGMISAVVDARNVDGMKLVAPPGGVLGGVSLDRLVPGVTVDAIGINGAKASVISRWDTETLHEQMRWRKPNLIILAFGTNEAFDNQFSPESFEHDLRQVVRQVRAAAPASALLILGAPSSAKKKPPFINAGCRIGLAPGLTSVLQIQRRIAQEERTLYWDWAAFMGGQCGAASWVQHNPPLMREDLVHMSAEGYAASGDALFDAMMATMRKGTL